MASAPAPCDRPVGMVVDERRNLVADRFLTLVHLNDGPSLLMGEEGLCAPVAGRQESACVCDSAPPTSGDIRQQAAGDR